MKFSVTFTRVSRRFVQISVILLLILAAKDSAFRQNALRNSRRLQDAFSPEQSRYESLLESHSGLDKTLNVVRGNLWYFDVGGVAISDDLAVVEYVFASHRLNMSFLLAGSWILLLSLGCGRVFCSYLCPAALLFDFGRLLRKGLIRVGFELPDKTIPRFTKYLLLGVGLAIASVAGRYTLAWIYPPRLICIELDHYILEGTLRFGVVFLLGIVLLEILVLPRAWCTHLCPGGALYSLLGSRRLLRIKLHEDRCTHCGACRGVCPYDLRPDEASPGMECDNCVRCIAACPEDALAYRRPRAIPKETTR